MRQRIGKWLLGDESGQDLVHQDLRKTKRRLQETRKELRQTKKALKMLAREWLLSRCPSGSVCVEVGVDEGEFSKDILLEVQPSVLHLVDPWQHFEDFNDSCYGGMGPEGQKEMDAKYSRVLQKFSAEIASNKVEIHRTTSGAGAEIFADESVDFVYIDANHSYEYVRSDLRSYLPKVKSGGIISGDDYGGKGWWDGGVEKAVDEFVESCDCSFELRGTQFLVLKH